MISSYLQVVQNFFGKINLAELASGLISWVNTLRLNNSGVQLAGLIISVFIFSFLIDLFLSHSVLGKSYRVFVAPGVILHEFSHTVLCLLTGAKISKVSLFDKQGGSVTHSAPKLPIFGQIFISLAPFFFGAAAIYILSMWLGLEPVDFNHFSTASLLPRIRSLFRFDLHNGSNWVILYLVLSIAVTMLPSRQDVKNMLLALIILGTVLYLVLRFSPFHIPFESIPLEKLIVLLSTIVLLLILALISSIFIYAVSKLFKQ